MAIRVGHGMTGAIAGAAGLLVGAESRRDRRGAAAARAFNDSLDMKRRQEEFAVNSELEAARLAMQYQRDQQRSQGMDLLENHEKPKKFTPPQVRERGADGKMHVLPRTPDGRELDRSVLNGGWQGTDEELREVYRQGSSDAASQNWIQQAMQQAGPGPGVYSKEQAQWQINSAQMLDQQAAEMRGVLSQDGLRDLSQIQSERANMTPSQYSNVMGQFFDRYQSNASGVDPRGVEFSPQYQDMWLRDSSRLLDEQAALIQEDMANANLTPEGKRKWGELAGKLRAIQSQRSGFRPGQYSQAMQQFFEEYQNSNLDAYRAEAPTVDSEMQSRFKDLGTGMGVFMQPDGKFQVLELKPKASDTPSQSSDTMSPGTFSDLMADEKRFSKAYDEAEKSLRDNYLQNLPADADPGDAPPEFTPAEIAVEMERRFRDQQDAAQKAAQRRQRTRQMILGEDPNDSQMPQTGQSVAPATPLSMVPNAETSQVQRYEEIGRVVQEAEALQTQDMSLSQQIDDLNSQYEKAMRHAGRRGFDKKAAEAIKSQRDALVKQQSQVQEQAKARVNQFRAFRDKEDAKQPGVQKLMESGHSPDDLAAAIRKISNYREKYPNLNDLNELPSAERKEITEALKVIRAAQ